MKKFYFSLVCLMFVACGDSNIDLVKKTTIPENKTMTIGDAIDYKKECKNVKWKDISKEGQIIVSASCKVKEEALKEQLESENYEARLAFDKYEKPKYQRLINNEYYIFKKNFKIISKTAVKFPSLEDVTTIAQKYCNEAECDEAFYEDLKNYNYEPRDEENANIVAMKAALKTALANIAKYDTLSIFVPKEVKSRTLEISFYINTDKSIDLRSAFIIDDELKESVYASRMLQKFYERF